MPEEFFPKEFSLKTMQNYAFPVKLPRDRAENAIFFSEELFGQGFCGRWRGLSQVLVDFVDVVEHIVLARF